MKANAITPIAVILLLAVFIRHGAIFTVAELIDFRAPATSYMLGAAFEVVLAGVIAFLLWGYRPELWRNLALGATLIISLEGFQMFACRLVIGREIGVVPPNTTLCDYVTGLPIGEVMFVLYLLVIVGAIGRAIASEKG